MAEERHAAVKKQAHAKAMARQEALEKEKEASAKPRASQPRSRTR